MGTDWPMYTATQLEDAEQLLIEDGNHGEYRPRRHEFGVRGVPFIRAAALVSGRIVFSSASRINDTALARIRKGIGAPGDVILSHKGTVGKVAFAPLNCEPFVCSPQTTLWRVLDDGFLDRRFLYYFMTSYLFQEQLNAHKGETDMADYVSLTVQRTLHLTVPPIQEQRAIAHFLGTLDNKIELNRRMNETLEAMARAIFKSWLVDFDPVRAKAEGRQPAGMDAGTAALFPDGFEESELGEIPRGWRVGTVDEDFRLTMGQSPPGDTYNEAGGGMPFYQGRADFGFRYPSRRVYCTAPRRLASPGDTLVSVRAPVGDINMAEERCCIGRGVAAIRHKSGSRSYTYYAMRGLDDVFATFEAEGTVFGSIGKKDFLAIRVLVPPTALVRRFEAAVFPMDEMIANNESQSRSLAQIRDTLLPALLSG